MRPGALTAGLVLGWIVSGLFLVQAIVTLVLLSGYAYTTAAQYLLLCGVPAVIGLLLGALLFGVAGRSEVARILFTVTAAIVIILALIGLLSGARFPLIALLVNLLQIGLLVAAIVCLFLPGVNRWMAHGRRSGFAGSHGAGPDAWRQHPPQDWNAQQPAFPDAPAHLRPCPYCAEPIRPEARKCRYCGSAVIPAA